MNLKDVEYNYEGLIIDCLSGSLLKDTSGVCDFQ